MTLNLSDTTLFSKDSSWVQALNWWSDTWNHWCLHSPLWLLKHISKHPTTLLTERRVTAWTLCPHKGLLALPGQLNAAAEAGMVTRRHVPWPRVTRERDWHGPDVQMEELRSSVAEMCHRPQASLKPSQSPWIKTGKLLGKKHSVCYTKLGWRKHTVCK